MLRRETLILWNMGFRSKGISADIQRSRLGLLEEMISERAPSIVALQEAVGVRRRTALGSAYEIVEGETGLITAFLKARWQVQGWAQEVKERALLVSVDSRDRRTRLRVWNVHIPNHWRTDQERRTYAQRLRGALNRVKEREESNRSDLVVGDFNLQPYDDAMMLPGFLHANRSYTWVAKRSTPRHVMDRPLFNPTWVLFGLMKPPYGTWYKSTENGGGPWFVWDQALMSAELALPGEPQVSLVERVGGMDLCARSKERAPNRSVGSDHLPLLVEFRAA